MSLVTRTLTIGSLCSAVVAGSFLHPVVSGQVMHTTTRGDPIGLGLLPSAAAFVALALVLGLAAFCRHSIDLEQLTPSSSTARRVATFAVVGLVISTAVIGGFGGPASPVGTVEAGYFEDCSFSDSLSLSIGASLGLSDQSCKFWSPDTDTENISNTDALAAWETEKQSEQAFITSQQNFGQDRYSVMMAKAKISLINDLNNNVSEANATANAKEVVQNYTANVQENVLNRHNSQMAFISYYAGTDANVSKSSTTESNNLSVSSYESYVTYSLADGREVNTTRLVYGGFYGTIGYESQPGISKVSEVTNGASSDTWDHSQDHYKVHTNDGEVIIYNGGGDTWYDLLGSLGSDLNQAESNIDVLANNTYTAYQAGEINATDLANSDPSVIGTEASTSYNSTGYYGYANAQLAALGLSGDTNASHVVTLEATNRTVTGTIFYTGEDSQTFDTGTTYDPNNLNGSVYMSVSTLEENGTEVDYSGGFLHVQENFTVDSATNVKTGESINTTTMETRDYSTTNVSNLQEELNELKELRDYYEEQQAASSGGISLDFGGVETGVIIALLAVAFLATRD